MNVCTFTNWITQPQYYSKWYPFVSNMSMVDILNHIPLEFRDKFEDLEKSLGVQLQPRYCIGPICAVMECLVVRTDRRKEKLQSSRK